MTIDESGNHASTGQVDLNDAQRRREGRSIGADPEDLFAADEQVEDTLCGRREDVRISEQEHG